MKFSSEIFDDDDLIHFGIDGRFANFGFVHKHDEQKVLKNKKAVKCFMVSRQKAEMLRDRLNIFLERKEGER